MNFNPKKSNNFKKNKLMEKKIKFKHRRFNIIQAIYGGLDEEASLLAVEQCDKRLDELFAEINEKSKDNKDWSESQALEMCYNKAESMEELIIFIHKVSAASACPSHPFIEMISSMRPPKDGGKG